MGREKRDRKTNPWDKMTERQNVWGKSGGMMERPEFRQIRKTLNWVLIHTLLGKRKKLQFQ